MAASYDYYSLQSQSQDSSKYFGVSVVLHIGLAVAALFVTIPMLEPKPVPVTIEILDEKPEEIKPFVKALVAPKGEEVPKTMGAKRENSPMPSAPMDSEVAEVVKGPVAKSTKSRSPLAKLKTKTGGGAKPIAVAKSAPSRAGVPETLEDIAAEELDFDGVVAAQKGNLGDNEFEDEFKNIDKSNAAAINAQKAELDNEAQMIADENEQALQALENQNQVQARAMEDALQATRAKNAAMLAQIKAAEQAAAEKAARDAAIAKLRAQEARGSGDGAFGKGSGSSGENRTNGTLAGDPNGLRRLDQLKQMPGNPKPSYSVEERLRREQGIVSFHAYVTNAGQLTKFKIVQSTGYQNLDGKTLAALKKWRFYPGQEGWVEVPYQWTLKGDVQELPTQLRRRYGSN